MTNETVASDPNGVNGAISYTYDPVGNRTQQTSSLPGITSGGFGYDADDRLNSDLYDANGNTVNSGGVGNVYDFENHLVQQGGATIVYDGDGNRVSKTVAGVTTKFLVSDVNPTGYAQVLSETFTGGSGARELSHTFVYGLDRISQFRSVFTGSQSLTQTSYYIYDGHGSVRALTDPSGNVTDTYDYDAFGNLIHSATTLSSPTLNEFLFAGEQFDSDLHLYYNRARYLNVTTGRFWTMDTFDGDPQVPLSAHKYLSVASDPVDGIDRSGNEETTITGLTVGITVNQVVNAISTVLLITVVCTATAALQNGLEQAGIDTPVQQSPCRSGLAPRILYRYTSSLNAVLISLSGILLPSIGDADFGPGQCFTDITPAEAARVSRGQFLYSLFRTPNRFGPFGVVFMAWNVAGLRVIRESPVFGPLFPDRWIYVRPSTTPLFVKNRVVAFGPVPFLGQ